MPSAPSSAICDVLLLSATVKSQSAAGSCTNWETLEAENVKPENALTYVQAQASRG